MASNFDPANVQQYGQHIAQGAMDNYIGMGSADNFLGYQSVAQLPLKNSADTAPPQKASDRPPIVESNLRPSVVDKVLNSQADDLNLNENEVNNQEARLKRRSKNDNEGRDHKCKYCDKTYLSYPALYTHTKQKHSTGPNGEHRSPPTSGRGRGRPRKSTQAKTDPTTEDFFYSVDKRGGPTDPTHGFDDLFELIFKDRHSGSSRSNHPLYRELLKFSRADKSEYQSEEEANQLIQQADTNQQEDVVPYKPPQLSKDTLSWQEKGWRCDYDASLKIDVQTRSTMLVDEIFALYLYTISLKTNPVYYKQVLAFIMYYRECFDQYGWAKRIQSEQIDPAKNPDIADKMKRGQYCATNTAEHAPEVCNEFVTVYMVEQGNNSSGRSVERQDLIDLTINLCHWLYENQFTCSKLSMMQ